ncbi:hypothetical protein ACFQUX_10485 [Pantoea stewartii]
MKIACDSRQKKILPGHRSATTLFALRRMALQVKRNRGRSPESDGER